ncbi:MAG TPA: poly(R)-hydroxyalkanoic acid synthase subunit PhaE [Gammaproteobacteria bacterium]|nr:poly(R)-hydroxyalkanoic acid synthase subunit PhaE [Gammaproteobacteria bacterium]
MDIADITATLERLYREGHKVLADFAEFANQPEGADSDALLERLHQQGERFFSDLRQQLQDQAQPWIAMLRAWAQLSDGASPAEILMTPMTWWRSSAEHDPANRESPRRARVEAVVAELAAARDAYLKLLQQAADGAVERFATMLRSPRQEQQNARQLYQDWLEAAETAYEEILDSEDFAAATGRLTNAWSELLLVLQDNLDGALSAAGLPTRRELSETQAQLHELRQQQRTRERQFRAELDALREHVANLTTAASPSRSRGKAKPAGTS